jgi:hypothetical protein
MTAFVAAFVAAPSPGQVYRFLQRSLRSERATAAEAAVALPALLLSDRVGARSYRALAIEGATAAEAAPVISRVAARLAPAFASSEAPLLVLRADADGSWGFHRWHDPDDVPETANNGPGAPLRSSFLRFLTPTARHAPAPVLWAQREGLPVDRVPGVARKTPPVVDYSTVAALDQKGLLYEDGTPRLYRLTF